MAIQTDGAHLLGAMIGLALYGFYLAIFVATIYRITRHKTSSRVVQCILVITFSITTIYYCLSMYDLHNAFIRQRVTPGTIAALNPYKRLTAVFTDTIYILILILTDSLLTWRLWVVWPENKWALRVACFLLLGGIVSSIGVLQYEVREYEVRAGAWLLDFYHWAIAGTVFSVANNLLLTACIGGRLWWLGRQIAVASPGAKSLYQRIVYVLIQSGSLYLLCMAAQITIYGADLQLGVPTFLYISPALISMSPTAIILQLTNEESKQQTAPAPRSTTGSIGIWARPPRNDTSGNITGGATPPEVGLGPQTPSIQSTPLPSGSVARTVQPAVSFVTDTDVQKPSRRRKAD